MDSHDYNVFTGVKIEIFFMGLDQIFSVNNSNVNTIQEMFPKIKECQVCMLKYSSRFLLLKYESVHVYFYVFPDECRLK